MNCSSKIIPACQMHKPTQKIQNRKMISDNLSCAAQNLVGLFFIQTIVGGVYKYFNSNDGRMCVQVNFFSTSECCIIAVIL
jgi:hypothetical protein